MDSSTVEMLFEEVKMGIPKTSSKFAPLTEVQNQIWDKMVIQVEEIKAMGQIPTLSIMNIRNTRN